MRISTIFYPFVITLTCCTAIDYCIIGAGPSGIQTAYFLKNRNADYKIFERSDSPASFYRVYPRHRSLISINKRSSGSLNKGFNLRHDWNSLLSRNMQPVFTDYSQQYFPQTDDLVKYLSDFAKQHELNMQFNVNIQSITQPNGNDPACKSELQDQNGDRHCCRTVIAATGLFVPNSLDSVKGSEYIERYETMNIEPTNYTNQRVLIIGGGNSGYEIAASLYEHAAFVHVAGRGRVRFSWDTHYVGDLRAVYNQVVDAYMLKSLDAVVTFGDVKDWTISKRADGRLQVHRQGEPVPEEQSDHYEIRDGYDRIISATGFHWDDSPFKSLNLTSHPNVRKFPHIRSNYQAVGAEGIYFAGTVTHSLDFRASAGGFIHGFRYTAQCLDNHLNWVNEGVPWKTSKRMPLSHLAVSVLHRINEASGLYQMFGTLVDLALIDRRDNTFVMLTEVSVDYITQLYAMTGHEHSDNHSIVVVTFEYGKDYSMAGGDHFELGRSTNTLPKAHLSKFLHPVIRVFHKAPKPVEDDHEKGYKTLFQKYEQLRPDGIVHLLEDLCTRWDAPRHHLMPLRRFLEFHCNVDLKTRTATDCAVQELTMKHSNTLICN